MVRKCRQIHPGKSSRSTPVPCGNEVAFPVIEISPLVGICQTIYIFNKTSGIIDLGSGFRITKKSLNCVFRPKLVGCYAILFTKYFFEVIQWMCQSVSVIVLPTELHILRFFNRLPMKRVGSTRIWPINWLLHMPEIRSMNLGKRF